MPGVDASLRLRYGPRLAITLASLPAGRVYSSYFQALSITGPSTEGSDYAWHVTGLPRGLFADRMSLSEAIAGRPQVAGKFTVTATVTTITSVPPFSAHRTFRLLLKPASPGRGYPRPMGSRSA